MIKKPIKFTDYNGNAHNEEYNFNLNRAEILEMEAEYKGGLEAYINRISKEEDNKKLFAFFKDLVLKSYGKKSDDGRRFEKSEALRTEFEQTEAYVELVLELVGNADAAAEFMNGIIPQV